MHLDNSACNLASLNLLKYLREAGVFDTEAFRRAVDIVILAQDILVDNSSYPTAEITANAHAFRELGLGYANLGALLMSLGLPYDSDAGRAYAAAVTALMSGEAYLQSAASRSNRPIRRLRAQPRADARVVLSHRVRRTRSTSHVPLDLLTAAREAWDETCVGSEARVSQFSNHGAGTDRDHRLHDGLRYHRRRARYRPDQVQKAGGRRPAQDRQQHGAAGAQASGLRYPDIKTSSSTSTSTRPSKARRSSRTITCRYSIAPSKRRTAPVPSITSGTCG